MARAKVSDEVKKDLALDVTQPVGSVFVSRVAYGEEEVSSEPLKVPNFQGQPTANVTVEAAYTKNLGNYESARIGIVISLPCFAVEEEVVRTYDIVQTMVSEILNEQVGALRK